MQDFLLIGFMMVYSVKELYLVYKFLAEEPHRAYKNSSPLLTTYYEFTAVMSI